MMRWAPSQEVTLVADGATLEGRCVGPAPDRAMTFVLLHEGLGSTRLWRDFPERLAAATGFGVLAYSRRGYGASDPVTLPRPLDYMTHEATRVLPEVLDAIGLERGILLGHSDGASIAALHAGNVQDRRVRGLVLVAPHFFTEPGGLASIAAAREAYATGDLRARLARHHRDVDGAFKGWNDAWLDPGFAAWSIEDAIDYVRVPVLAIQGRDDQYGTSAQLDVLARRLYAPYDEAVLEDCRHSPFVDQPEATLRAVAAFAARLARIEGVDVQAGARR